MSIARLPAAFAGLLRAKNAHHAACSRSPEVLRQADSSRLELAFAAFAAKLLDDFADLGDTGRAHGVALRF
jgi:hypothetical protein